MAKTVENKEETKIVENTNIEENKDTVENTEEVADIDNNLIDRITEAVSKKFEDEIASLKAELKEEKEKKGLSEEEVKKLLEDQKSMFNLSRAELEKMAKEENTNTKAELDKQPKVRIKIPVSELNPNDKVVFVSVNGYNYSINRGETVEVPEEIAKLLEIGKYI